MFLFHFTIAVLQAEVFISPGFLYVAIAVTTGLIFLLVVSLLVLLLVKNSRSLKQKELQHQFKDWLVGIILEETDVDHLEFEVPHDIRKLLKNSFARQVLLQELKGLKQSLSGQPSENLEKLYRQLNLQTISCGSLQRRLWHLKSKGIQELAAMNQQGVTQDLFLLTNHKHPNVRMEAQIAMVVLKQYEGLQLFENLVYPLTEWHQIKLLQLLAHQPIPSEAAIVRWLHSSNYSVVQFALKLIGEQHALYFQEEVIACLYHTDETVRRQAIICLGYIPSARASASLKRLFACEPHKDLQLVILNELIRSGAIDDLLFLQTLQENTDIDIKLAADRATYYLLNHAVA